MLSYVHPSKLKVLADFSIDLAKVLVISAVIGFFIPGLSGNINTRTFVFGSLLAILLLSIGLKLTPEKL